MIRVSRFAASIKAHQISRNLFNIFPSHLWYNSLALRRHLKWEPNEVQLCSKFNHKNLFDSCSSFYIAHSLEGMQWNLYLLVIWMSENNFRHVIYLMPAFWRSRSRKQLHQIGISRANKLNRPESTTRASCHKQMFCNALKTEKILERAKNKTFIEIKRWEHKTTDP